MDSVVGFTGTQKGMTSAQIRTLRELLRGVALLHHGDCIGADAHAHTEAVRQQIPVVIHPPTDPTKRAFCEGARIVKDPEPYLIRNHRIVDASDKVIAAPGSFREGWRSGTWATVRYARKVNKQVTIIWPDGTVA